MEDEPDIFRSATKLIHAKSDPSAASGRAPQPQPQVDLLKAKIDLEAAKRVIFELGVAAMTAQSDPHAKAAVYRKALIDICNAALKAQSSAGEGRAPAPQPDKVGITVTCVVCGFMKKPIGRSGPLAAYYCDEDCKGYRQPPFVGSLWPGEKASEFGFPCSDDGTEPVTASAPAEPPAKQEPAKELQKQVMRYLTALNADIEWTEVKLEAARVVTLACEWAKSPQPEPEKGWQPIESAPKDSRIFLGAWFANDPSRWLDDVGRYETTGGVGTPLKHEWNWRWAGQQPTHWMPLPAPPSSLPSATQEPK